MCNYLLMIINGGKFIVNIKNVIKVVDVCKINNVPVKDKSMIGVISDDGDLIPIIDIRPFLDINIDFLKKDNYQILIISIDNKKTGIIIDDALDIIEIDEIISKKPIKSIINNDEILIFLNIEKIIKS